MKVEMSMVDGGNVVRKVMDMELEALPDAGEIITIDNTRVVQVIQRAFQYSGGRAGYGLLVNQIAGPPLLVMTATPADVAKLDIRV